jgi:molybdate transport system ATP-binding protein
LSKSRLSVQLRHRIGALKIDVEFELTKPWTILFGPSGSGKTTILRAIAGLLRPDFARIVSRDLADAGEQQSVTLVDTERGVFLPAHRRAVRFAPQQAALFPHLTVLENLTYGLRPGRKTADEMTVSESEIGHLLSSFRIAELASKRPVELSGGEAQGVNLARAVVAGNGHLLLLDEPFSGLDMPQRDELVGSLLQRQSDAAAGQILSVTHDVGEAFQIEAEVIRIADGRMVAHGPVKVVLAEERKRLLAQLMNVSGSSKDTN